MKWIVEIGYQKMAFQSAVEAATFADTAAEHYVCEDNEKMHIEITPVSEEGEV